MQRFRTARPSGDIRTFQFINDEGEILDEGWLCLIQETCGVLLLDIQYTAAGCKEDKKLAIGDSGVLVYHIEKIMVDKLVVTGMAFLPGDKVYWSGTNGDGVTEDHNAQTAPYWIGICVWPAVEADTLVMIDLKGDKISITEPL